MKQAHPERMVAPGTQSSPTEQVAKRGNLRGRTMLRAIERVTVMGDAVLAFWKSWGVLVATGAVSVATWVAIWVVNRRDRRRWEVQEQLREMEQAIWEEGLPDEQREWLRRYGEEQAEIKREARRRLGLPEEEPHR
jgi:hypothetical protein